MPAGAPRSVASTSDDQRIAAQYGRPSPTSIASPTPGSVRRSASTLAGKIFFPYEVASSSFLRPWITSRPSGGQVAEVAGLQPAVADGRFEFPLEVTARHLGTTDQDLAVVGDADLGLGQGLPDRPDADSRRSGSG